MRTPWLAAAAALLATPASAVASSGPPAPPPPLLIVISVDQLSSDLFEEYRPHFTGGLARLSRGTVFRNGYQAHAATETCPGHATILTGAHPSRNGIIANNWYDLSLPRADKEVYCAEDERVSGSSSENYTLSAVHLKVPTLGDLLERPAPSSVTVAVAGKDRAAIMMGGRRPDQRWYWDGRRFATDRASAPVPRSVTGANAAVAAAISTPRPPLVAPPLCEAKSGVVSVEGSGKQVGSGRFARSAGDTAAFRNSPEFDGAVLALSAALIGELKLGSDSSTDLMSISLSATDYVGHSYGPGGSEMCLQLLSLDRDLGDFFTRLDRSGLDYAVALTADHGGQDLPERLRAKGRPNAARVDSALEASAVGRRIGAKLGLKGPVLVGDYIGDIYIDEALTAAQRPAVLGEALDFYRAHPQVAAAFSAGELQRTPLPTMPPDRWALVERARASFDPERSGDLVVLLRPYVTPLRSNRSAVATHGSPWDYDRRVPIIFWRPAMAAADRDEAIRTVDIMPTLAAMIGIPLAPESIDGQCLSNISGIVCPKP